MKSVRLLLSLKHSFSSTNPTTIAAAASSTAKPSPTTASAASAVADLAEDDVDVDDDDMVGMVQNTAPSMKHVAMPDVLQPRVVVFDGVCPLCHSGVKLVIKADKHRKIKFCCLQSETAEPYMNLCGVDKEDVLHRFIFVEGLGQYHQASTAALKVASYLPLPYSALSSLLIIPTPVRDGIYDFIAKRRYDWFGKKDKCLVLQEPEMLERFIDREEIMERHQSDI